MYCICCPFHVFDGYFCNLCLVIHKLQHTTFGPSAHNWIGEKSVSASHHMLPCRCVRSLQLQQIQ